MSKKTRLIILIFCVLCFFVIAPVLILYSMGDRFDLDKMKVVATGGIYVRTFPSADQITIDSKISEKPGFLANSIFVQSLLPKNHVISIKKAGYFSYSKTLPVQENQVTKLENVLLIKNKINFSDLADKVNYFSVAPDNQNILLSSGAKFEYLSLNGSNPAKTVPITLTGTVSDIEWSGDSTLALAEIQNSGNSFYYLLNVSTPKITETRLTHLDKNSQQISFNPQDDSQIFYIRNKTLYSLKANIATPILSNIDAYKISGNSITWLSVNGALSSSDILGKITTQLTSENFAVNSKNDYQLTTTAGKTFLEENNNFFVLNTTTKVFESLKSPITGYTMITSPDGLNIIYFNKNSIYVSKTSEAGTKKILLYESSSENISDCYWLNNDYVIFTSGGKILISEIDYRGNINTVTLPAKTASQMFFDSQDNKIYELTDGTLLS